MSTVDIINNAFKEYNSKKENALINQIIKLCISGDIQVAYTEDIISFNENISTFITIQGAVQVTLPKYDKALERIAKLTKQNDVMREALKFYADGNSWVTRYIYDAYDDNVEGVIDDSDLESTGGTFSLGGKRARQALKDVEGVG